jgi:hypothetical protein
MSRVPHGRVERLNNGITQVAGLAPLRRVSRKAVARPRGGTRLLLLPLAPSAPFTPVVGIDDWTNLITSKVTIRGVRELPRKPARPLVANLLGRVCLGAQVDYLLRDERGHGVDPIDELERPHPGSSTRAQRRHGGIIGERSQKRESPRAGPERTGPVESSFVGTKPPRLIVRHGKEPKLRARLNRAASLPFYRTMGRGALGPGVVHNLPGAFLSSIEVLFSSRLSRKP